MGTSNFYNKNASNVFACEIENDFDYNDLKENLDSILEENDYFSDESYNDNRNFRGLFIGKKTFTFSNKTKEVSAIIKPIIRSGYYQGVNLDYEFEIIDEYGYELNDYEKGTKTIFQKAQKALHKEIKNLEKIFSEIGTPLNVVARFSNGETIYQKANINN